MTDAELHALEAILAKPAGSFPLPDQVAVRDALRSYGYLTADDAAVLYGASGNLVREVRRLRKICADARPFADMALRSGLDFDPATTEAIKALRSALS